MGLVVSGLLVMVEYIEVAAECILCWVFDVAEMVMY